MKRTNIKLFATLFILPAVCTTLPAMAAFPNFNIPTEALEAGNRVINPAKFTMTVQQSALETDNGAVRTLSDEEFKKCKFTINQTDCVKDLVTSSNPISFSYICEIKKNPKDYDTQVITAECDGYKKEIVYPGRLSDSTMNKSITLEKSNNIFKKGASAVGDAAKKTGAAIGGAAKGAWNGVSGLFKGAEPCSDDATKALQDANPCPAGKCTGSLVEKTKLDTKQTGTDGKDGKTGKCLVSKCVKNYVPNDTKTGCEQSGGECTPDAENATAGELKKGKCIITECGNGYHPSDDGDKCEQAELSKEDSKAKVDELKDNAQKMKDKERSTANKALSAAAIGATGIGGMNLMSGLAEQKADAAAEEDMKAYLATFVCDYGQGRNIRGGETNIEVPGGNDLIQSVTEYKLLAADLKARKEALGKQPGIESEVIFDIAETGLYDNVGMGRQSGAYTSLSRALTDETSKDAEEWAKQKEDTASKVKTGAITAGAGAIGGLIGNLAINSGEKNKNKVDEINRRYEKLKITINKINNTPIVETDKTCPGDATGEHPSCECNDTGKDYNAKTKLCEAKCPGELQWDNTDNECKCPGTAQPTQDNKCVEPAAQGITCDINKNVVLNKAEDACECKTGFVQSEPSDTTLAPTACKCPDGTEPSENGCVPKTEPTPDTESFPINAASLFKRNSATLERSATANIDEIYNTIQKNDQTCNMRFIGYADPIGDPAHNKDLSRRRAKAVQTAFENAAKNDTATNKPKITFSSEGKGEIDCTCGVAKDVNITISASDKETKICNTGADNQNVSKLQPKNEGVFAPCRRVVIETNCTSESDIKTIIKGT